jgi:dephospho-CoA kinase
MTKIALTGGIATGKSYVLARLKDRGVPVIDADDIVHVMLGSSTPIAAAIAAKFGGGFLQSDGSVDRVKMAAKVFSEPSARREVEAIIHPAVYEKIREWFDTLDTSLGVASIPLLYETNRQDDFDMVVVTACPPEQQLQRLLAREGMSESEARGRIAAQMPVEEKAARGDVVIHTGGSKTDTDRQVDEWLAGLRRR